MEVSPVVLLNAQEELTDDVGSTGSNISFPVIIEIYILQAREALVHVTEVWRFWTLTQGCCVNICSSNVYPLRFVSSSVFNPHVGSSTIVQSVIVIITNHINAYKVTRIKQNPPNAAKFETVMAAALFTVHKSLTRCCEGYEKTSKIYKVSLQFGEFLPGIYLGSSFALKTFVEINPDELARATKQRLRSAIFLLNMK